MYALVRVGSRHPGGHQHQSLSGKSSLTRQNESLPRTEHPLPRRKWNLSKATSDVIENVTPAAGGMHSAAAVLKSKAGLSTSLTESLGSIGLGVLVLGLVGAGIAVGVNFTRDAGAKDSLNSVKSAETIYQGANDVFGDLDALTSGETPALTNKPDNLKVAATDTNYCAVVKSKSMTGPTFWMTGKSGKILTAAPTTAEAGVACPTL